MACEDAAARVAEIRARHAEYPPPEWSEVAILLAALAAAEAERDRQAELRAEWQTMAEEFRAIAATRSTERDQARADAADAMLAHGLAVESLRHVEAECKRDLAAAEQRATRLAAVAPIVAEAERLAETQRRYERGELFGTEWKSRQRVAIGRLIAAVAACGAPGENGEPDATV